jgi:hypothetical protein
MTSRVGLFQLIPELDESALRPILNYACEQRHSNLILFAKKAALLKPI